MFMADLKHRRAAANAQNLSKRYSPKGNVGKFRFVWKHGGTSAKELGSVDLVFDGNNKDLERL
jgi:hypothetical protein